jgi:hypothetical protein
VWSCVNGHANSPGAEYCATCGARVETGVSADRLYGGSPGTEYASDYASGSFAEYIDELDGDTGIPAFRAGSFPAPAPAPAAAPAPAPAAAPPPPDEPARTPVTGFSAMLSAPLPAPVDAPPPPSRRNPGYPGWPDDSGQPDDVIEDQQPAGRGWYDDGPATKPGPVLSGEALDELSYRRPSRTRMLIGVAAVAILGIAGVTGTLAVMHSHNGSPQAGGSGSGQASSASPSPAQSGAATQNVAQWTTPVAIDPQNLASSTAITGLSCTPRGGCYAADSAGTVLALHSSGNWPVAATDPNGGLVALSCPTAGSCLTIDSQGLSMMLRHGTWSSPASIGTGSGTVTSASCASPDFCLAVDSIGQAFTYAGPSAGWSQRTVAPSGQALNAVSCASRTACVAVGAGGAVYSYDGASWTGPATVDSGHDLVSVSCPSAGFCMAVDTAGDAVQFSAGHWAAQPLGFTAAAVSCPAVGTCLAVGGGGVATYGGDHWTAPAAVDTAGVNRIDCVAVNSCVATDQNANALFYSASAK